MLEATYQNLGELIKNKHKEKKQFFKDQSFHKDTPLIAVILDQKLTAQEQKLLTQLLEAGKSTDLPIVVLADKKEQKLNENHSCKIIPYNRKNRHQVLQAADIVLSFDFNDVQELLLQGIVPVSASREELTDYNPNKEIGNSFIYNKKNAWSIFAALVRAVETYRFPYDWKNIVRFGLESISV